MAAAAARGRRALHASCALPSPGGLGSISHRPRAHDRPPDRARGPRWSLTTEYGDLESSQTMFSTGERKTVVKLLRANGECLGAGKR